MAPSGKGKAKASTKIDNIGSSNLILRTSNGISGMVDNFQRKLKEVDAGTFFFHVVLELDFSNSQVQVVSNFFELLKRYQDGRERYSRVQN